MARFLDFVDRRIILIVFFSSEYVRRWRLPTSCCVGAISPILRLNPALLLFLVITILFGGRPVHTTHNIVRRFCSPANKFITLNQPRIPSNVLVVSKFLTSLIAKIPILTRFIVGSGHLDEEGCYSSLIIAAHRAINKALIS